MSESVRATRPGTTAAALPGQPTNNARAGVPSTGLRALLIALTGVTGLAADSPLGGGPNPRPIRRITAVGTMLGGALAGGVLTLHAGLSMSLAFAALALALVTLGFAAGIGTKDSSASRGFHLAASGRMRIPASSPPGRALAAMAGRGRAAKLTVHGHHAGLDAHSHARPRLPTTQRRKPMRPRQPRLPVRHGAVGTARRPDPSVEDDPRPARPSPAPTRRNRPWLALVAVVVYAALFFGPGLVSSSSATSLAYSTFLTDVSNHGVASVAVSGTGALSGTLTGGREFTSQAPPWALTTDDLATRLEAAGVHVSAYQQNDTLVQVALALLPTLLLVGAFWWLGRRAQRTLGGGGGLGGLMRTKARVTDAERPTTRFEDVAGYEGAKQEVREVVDYLQHPERYRRAGAQGPRGLLLVGPPGTGKTLLARAVAGEASVPFFAVTGSSFVEVFVGLGASRVRDLFSEARRSAPAIVFIDEIDAIGARRAVAGGGTNDEREQTLNQLLSEMDGFTGNGSIVVIAATNRPEVLDQALLRPGRFDRQVTVPLPNLRDRQRILAVHVQGKQLAADVDLGIVARGTAGFSGADLANLVNEAALRAARADRVDVRRVDFDEARDRLILGRREDSNALLPQERITVAVHEGGHALVAALSPTGDPVAKITILPAGMALGATHQLPEDDRRLYSESYLLDSLAIRVAGRAAELLVSGEASTGAADDLAGATQLAVRMVREYGFSTELGPVAYPLPAATQLDTTGLDRPYAEATQRQVDDEVGRLLRDAEARATELLTLHRAALDSLTRHLLEEETVDGSVVYDLLLHPHGTGDRPQLVDGE